MRSIINVLLVILIALVFSPLLGCRLGLYVGIGPQQFDKVSIEIEGQKADPNIPEGLFDIGVGL